MQQVAATMQLMTLYNDQQQGQNGGGWTYQSVHELNII
jgi:hypothetical protein